MLGCLHLNRDRGESCDLKMHRPCTKTLKLSLRSAGKSSIALAFSCILKASNGQILIDGEDISTIPIKELRKRIAIVPQQLKLFERTISSNLDLDNKYTDRRKTKVFKLVHF
jgi:ABC-type multidrug transport system fused ATPase/permease subunit